MRVLTGANILLRPFDESDAAVLAQLANSTKIWNNVRDAFPNPYCIEDAMEFIRLTQKEDLQMTFAIEYETRLCGVAGLVAQSDVYRRTAEIGYWIGEAYWHKGIATAAVELITEYGFSELQFVRIHAGIFEYNTGSMKVLSKNGYVKDGIFKKAILKNGQLFDEHRFSKTI